MLFAIKSPNCVCRKVLLTDLLDSATLHNTLFYTPFPTPHLPHPHLPPSSKILSCSLRFTKVAFRDLHNLSPILLMHLIATPHTSQAILWFIHSINNKLFLLINTEYGPMPCHFSVPFSCPSHLSVLKLPLGSGLRPTSAPSARICQLIHPFHTNISLLKTPAEVFNGITLFLWQFLTYWRTVYQWVHFLYPPIDCKLLESTVYSLSLPLWVYVRQAFTIDR